MQKKSNPSITVVLPALESMDHPLAALPHFLLHLSMWGSSDSDSASNKIETVHKTINMKWYKYK